MIGAHIAHDCIIGNNVVIANSAAIAGHAQISDDVIIGGNCGIQQFIRIGRMAMIGGMSGVSRDVIPYGLSFGNRNYLEGINLVGLRRKKVSNKEIIVVNNKQIKVKNYLGIRSDVSKLKLRGCFKVDQSLFEKFDKNDKASPLSAPFWFKCFDYKEIQSDIDKGVLKAYLAEENETPGIDRYIAISKNGLGYEWRQLNEMFVK